MKQTSCKDVWLLFINTDECGDNAKSLSSLFLACDMHNSSFFFFFSIKSVVLIGSAGNKSVFADFH